MGNSVGCFSSTQKELRKKTSKHDPYFSPPNSLASSSNRKDHGFILPSLSSSKKEENNLNNINEEQLDEDLAEQAIAAAMLFRHHQRNGTLPFPRSSSVTYASQQGSHKKQGFTKSSSSRQRSLADPLLKPSQLVNQDLKIEDLETKHFVLVHGGGFGAWCWYKIITLLVESGFRVDAVDLTGSGTHSSDTNSIKTLSQYIKPLTDIFNKLQEGEKVILVGHDIGGACISYMMELFPSQIAKSVFIAATMLNNGQSALDILSQQYLLLTIVPAPKIDKDKVRLLPSKSARTALASVSMRPIPFAPLLEKLSLSDKNYGSIPRFYIKTQEDCVIPVSLQESMIESNPPEQIFQVKGSDHAPFFSKPRLCIGY
ncbi:hypothetical protein GH714_028730 [Hevea brasiliensis]|uniref:AB hydrolase-1 domain-containing protein n=1 Tax=Hevea brasiliensis TaxID=3981 RepID=A0A6A6NJM0_HEVBR|nr:hypothetical protein GH714_028730 [Hevea brasiliensis]